MSKITKNEFRTNSCGELKENQTGQEVILSGWVKSRRDHGGLIFVDLRDFYGITQIVFDPKINKQAHQKAEQVRSEWCLKVKGLVRKRIKGMENLKLKTGQIEIEVHELVILSKSQTPPFEIKDKISVNEELRLEYRYLDLRRNRMKENLKFRAAVNLFIRNWFSERDFLEVETPLLSAPAPEGARDFLVPARREPGKFFALPQSPQIFKQFLMYSCVDKYFQIAPAFRDEDSRADRHVDVHYQLDLEMAFVKQEDVWQMYEDFLSQFLTKFGEGKKLLQKPLPRFSYNEAIERFGTEKPDLRFALELMDVTKEAQKTDFKIFKQAQNVRALKVPKARQKAFESKDLNLKVYGKGDLEFSRKDIDELTEIAKGAGAPGLAWIKIDQKGQASGAIAKFLNLSFIRSLKPEPFDTIFFAADNPSETAKILDIIRRNIQERFKLGDPDILAFCWINDFPLFEPVEEGAHGMSEKGSGVQFGHNPFTNPDCTLKQLKEARKKGVEELLKIKARQFDLACNGYEMFSGGERCTDGQMLSESFEAVGYSKKVIDKNFGPIMKAFKFGPPPHAGLGQGIDRLLMLLRDEPNVREMTAFPKTAIGQDLMLGAPRKVSKEVLDELRIEVKKDEI
ncbi:MAG: aspartate--tRNA ligase [Candidatus Moranbacteria bacterium]|nr:aspartate--tRNA ligase [Candidatus Moranbacteria bacterium]